MKKKLRKPYLTNFNSLIAQDLWQTHYQKLLIILQKEFTKLNITINTILQSAKCVKLNTMIVSAVICYNNMNIQMLNMI